MDRIKVAAEFYPIRMPAYRKDTIDLILNIENSSPEPMWVECDLTLPDQLSLSDGKKITKGRIRLGLLMPTQNLSRPIKVYGSVITYPDVYSIPVSVYCYNRHGQQEARHDTTASLRCEKIK